MYIYDSVQKTKLAFIPQDKNKVSIYVCGPTVYDDAHLGHARSSLAFDLLRLVLESKHYEVTFVKNITDIDDKIINKMAKTKQSLDEITQFFTSAYHSDMDKLGIKRPDIEPKATQSIDAIVQMIQTLFKKNIAYSISNGDIYFDTSKDNDYLSLSCRASDDNQSRIENIQEKRQNADYALWKHCKDKDDVCFDTILGKGRPGWHIECSAMIEKHLHNHDHKFIIDIHGGGADLLFPHHENEASQSRCATGKNLAKYWMHNGFVTVDGQKMAKSLGNSFFIKDALKVYDGEILRFYLLSTHYRQNFNFNEEDLLNSKKRLDKMYRLKKRLFGKAGAKKANKDFQNAFLLALYDDLNISVALSVIDNFISKSNEQLDKDPKNKLLIKESIANLALIQKTLGLLHQDPFAYFQLGLEENLKIEITKLIKERDEAKKQKDYALADNIREKLLKLDIAIMDTANGTVWEKN